MQLGLVGYPYEDVFHTLNLVCNKRGFRVLSADFKTGIIHAVKSSGIFFIKSKMILKVVRLDGTSTRIEVSVTRKNKEDEAMETHFVDTIYHFF